MEAVGTWSTAGPQVSKLALDFCSLDVHITEGGTSVRVTRSRSEAILNSKGTAEVRIQHLCLVPICPGYLPASVTKILNLSFDFEPCVRITPESLGVCLNVLGKASLKLSSKVPCKASQVVAASNVPCVCDDVPGSCVFVPKCPLSLPEPQCSLIHVDVLLTAFMP